MNRRHASRSTPADGQDDAAGAQALAPRPRWLGRRSSDPVRGAKPGHSLAAPALPPDGAGQSVRQRLHDLGDLVCCGLLVAVFVVIVLLLLAYVWRMPFPIGIPAG
jgi:hypothetical protein